MAQVCRAGVVREDDLRARAPDRVDQRALQALAVRDLAVGLVEEVDVLDAQQRGAAQLLALSLEREDEIGQGGIVAAARTVGDNHDLDRGPLRHPLGHRRAAAELAVVGVGRDDERALRRHGMIVSAMLTSRSGTPYQTVGMNTSL